MSRVRRIALSRWTLTLVCISLAACGGSDGGSSSTTSTTSSSAGSNTGTGTGTGTGTPTAGTLALTAASATAAQSATRITLTVARAGDMSQAATVNYATADGTGVAGTNYVAAQGTLSWSAGDSGSKTIVVTLMSTAFTGNKTFSVTLTDATGATLGTVAAETVSMTGTAAVTMPGTLAFSAASDAIAQSAGSVILSVTRTGGSDGAATIGYATHDGTALAGTQYTAASGTLTWAAGDATPKSLTITLNATAFTGSKTFSATLTNAVGASVGSVASATVTITGNGTATAGPAAALAVKLGKPSRLLIGIGEQGSADPVSTAMTQGLKIDIYTRYLGSGDWTSWNSPPCDYVCVVAAAADSIGAVPMYTQYQMANDGDGNISVINDASFMTTYWSRVKLLFQDLATYNKPALVNLEPDFWGYAEQAAPNGDPTQLAAVVSSNPDCASLPNNVTGLAKCLLAMARQYAPKAYVGFPPSSWGAGTDAQVVAFMNAIGAQNADFVVEQTLDRDAGCYEVVPQPAYCSRAGSGWYWDETNQTHPNFQDYLSQVQNYHTGIGNLPVILWQTPQGVPATTTGGTDFHYRDNREHYFLTHPGELTAAGGLAVLFSTGETHQTNITTDGGQFQTLSSQYLAAPAVLP